VKSEVLEKLEQGDLRTIGQSNAVVDEVLKNPQLFDELFQGLFNNNPAVCARVADALEKISKVNPELLQPYKDKLIHRIANIPQQEIQWHVAQMFSYLDLSKKEIEKVVVILNEYLQTSESIIVKVMSLQALTDLVSKDSSLRYDVLATIDKYTKKGSPSLVARGKKLRKQLVEVH
jgi:hypothetical protein